MLCDLATLADRSSIPEELEKLDTLFPPPRPLKHNILFLFLTKNAFYVAHNFRALFSSALHTVARRPRLEKCEPRSESEAEPGPAIQRI